MKNKEHEPKDKILSTFETSPITHAAKKWHESNIAMPSVEDVKESKDWVDHNEK